MNTASHSDSLIEQLRQLVGVEQTPGPWFDVNQEDVNRFADVTRDHNYLHVDPQRAARESPYQTTIAHGFFTISLMSFLVHQIPAPDPNPYTPFKNAINYGMDRLRLVAPVPVGARIRAQRKLLSANLKKPGMVQVNHEVVIQIENESRPACVAQWITLLLY